MVKVAIAAITLLLLLTGLATAAPAPTLRLQSMKPLVVTGQGFRLRERVNVTTVASTVTLRRVVVARAGRFAVSFGDLTFGRCGGFVVRARGSEGSIAVLKRAPLPACMP